MSENEVIIGNLTTIIMFVFSACGGGAIIDALGGTSQTAIVIGAILGLIFSYINAYYPNFFKFLNNHEREINDVASCVNKHECGCNEAGEEEVIENSVVDNEIVDDFEDEV